MTFFPNLNGLRFVAAFVVILHHLEQMKLFFGFPTLFYDMPFFKAVGDTGVTLFFVLSGFLITYLLLAEKEKHQTIDIRKFYIRRFLRILPIYYLIIFLGLFIFPLITWLNIPNYTDTFYHRFTFKTGFYLLLLPNLVNNLYAYMPYLAQTWSIGVEEQFYAIWPILVRRTQRYGFILGAIVVGMFVLTNVLALFADHRPDISAANTTTKIITLIYRYFYTFRIGSMAIGGLGAYYLFFRKDLKKEQILSYVFNPFTQFFNLLLILFLVAFGIEFPILNPEIYSLLFIVLMLNLAANPKTIIHLNYPILEHLGKLSYGLYMWHPLMIVVSLRICTYFLHSQLDSIGSTLCYYLLTIFLAITTAELSYRFFEQPFLKWKDRFTQK